MAILSAFADEVTENFTEQVKFLQSEKVSSIEIRFVNRKNVIQLSQSELDEAKKILDDHGVRVGAIGSPIGKVKLDTPAAEHLDLFKHAVEVAQFFGTPLIRVFSYYPPEGRNINDCRDEVLERMRSKLEFIKGQNIVLVHENETGIYGHSAANCADMAETLESSQFKLAYDSGNFVWGQKITNSIEECWLVMKPYVAHVHIKDWTLNADVGSMPGTGDGQITELLAELASMHYAGQITMEPHLRSGGQFGGDTGTELFSEAIAAVRKIAAEKGLNLQ